MEQEKSLQERIDENGKLAISDFKASMEYNGRDSMISMGYGFLAGMAGIEALNLFIDGHYVLGGISSAVTLLTGAISIKKQKTVNQRSKRICNKAIEFVAKGNSNFKRYDECYKSYMELSNKWEELAGSYNQLASYHNNFCEDYNTLLKYNSQWEKAYNSLQKENNQWQEAYNQLKSQNTQLRNIINSKSFENRVDNTWVKGNKVEKKPN